MEGERDIGRVIHHDLVLVKEIRISCYPLSLVGAHRDVVHEWLLASLAQAVEQLSSLVHHSVRGNDSFLCRERVHGCFLKKLTQMLCRSARVGGGGDGADDGQAIE